MYKTNMILFHIYGSLAHPSMNILCL